MVKVPREIDLRKAFEKYAVLFPGKRLEILEKLYRHKDRSTTSDLLAWALNLPVRIVKHDLGIMMEVGFLEHEENDRYRMTREGISFCRELFDS